MITCCCNAAKLKYIETKLDQKIRYMEKHCIMKNTTDCKRRWKEIASLHKVATKLQNSNCKE
uniref:Uncharacterized protein n=1 Tax=Pyramimonas orientalis virus TaxID=455367 RepID=A0A7M3UP74_POV01|nr:hypothetical protein HWQ62_00412 [Pyramimonas orientalis virus]